MIKNYILFIVAALSFTLCCRVSPDVTSDATENLEQPDQEGWEATLTSTFNGQVSSIIRYHRMQKFSKGRRVDFLDGVEMEFYNRKHGYLTLRAHAQQATLNEIVEEIELSGDVVVHAPVDDLVLYTQKLILNQGNHEVRSDERVMIVTAQNDTIYGVGFEASGDFEDWTIKDTWGTSSKSLNLKENE